MAVSDSHPSVLALDLHPPTSMVTHAHLRRCSLPFGRSIHLSPRALCSPAIPHTCTSLCLGAVRPSSQCRSAGPLSMYLTIARTSHGGCSRGCATLPFVPRRLLATAMQSALASPAHSRCITSEASWRHRIQLAVARRLPARAFISRRRRGRDTPSGGRHWAGRCQRIAYRRRALLILTPVSSAPW